jgi:hypothetical protein
MVEHTPWVGPNYRIGIEGQRICIVGYSHYKLKNEICADDCTTSYLRKVRDGTRERFFGQIMGYFGFKDHQAFWNGVMFLNYITECIGDPKERYNSGTDSQIKCAKQHFLNIIRKKCPHKVLVFTRKGWSTFPPTSEGPMALDPKDFPEFSWGIYHADGHIVMAFGLRHPQGATHSLMQRAVRYILDKPFTERATTHPPPT